MEFALIFMAGMFIGACTGVVLFACVAMSGLQDDMQERIK